MNSIIKPRSGLEADIPTGADVIDRELIVTDDTRKAFIGDSQLGKYVELDLGGSGGGGSLDNSLVLMEAEGATGSFVYLYDGIFKCNQSEQTLTGLDNGIYRCQIEWNSHYSDFISHGEALELRVSSKSKQWLGIFYEPGHAKYSFPKKQISSMCRAVDEVDGKKVYFPIDRLEIRYPAEPREAIRIVFAFETPLENDFCDIEILSPIPIPNVSLYC